MYNNIMLVPLDYFTTKKGIEKYSNPKMVQKRAKEYGVDIVFSPRKNKKCRIVNPENKYVDFGMMGMSDYTHHLDEHRRELFRKRNRRFKDAPKYSASHLSYYLLW